MDSSILNVDVTFGCLLCKTAESSDSGACLGIKQQTALVFQFVVKYKVRYFQVEMPQSFFEIFF